jgi:hypothetical protein
MSRKLITRICDVLALVGLANFLVWSLVGAVFLGGSAFHGKQEVGRYFLADHGHYREVSRGTFTYSRIHGYTAFAGLGLGVCASLAGYQLRKDAKRNETQMA